TRYPDTSPDALREQIRLASEHIDAENPGHAGQLGRGYVNAEASLEMPVFPAVRLVRWTWDDSDSDLMIMSGEEVTIKAVFVNHLADAQELSIGLTGSEPYPYIDLSNAEHMVGRLTRGDSTEVTLRFVVASDAPSSRVIRLYTRIRDGAFVDEPDQLSFGINSRIELDHAALSALFTSTGGASWQRNRNWNINSVPTLSELAQWYGVVVSHGVVSRLSLCRNHLTGTLPSELGNLQGLEDLRLCDNSITGEIPPELGNLTQLQRLELDRNSLTGNIPNELGDLAQLRRLELHTNSFTGEIPSELGNLVQLQRLELGANSLTGEIPSELGNLTQLQRLDLGANSLSGDIPSELGNLSQLTQLYLHDNAFTGRLPRSLTQLTNLKALHFSGQDLCAPGDFAFQVWLSIIPDVSGSTCSGVHFIDRVADQSFPRAQPLVPVVLPEAAGASPINYSLTPTLPPGLFFDQVNRTLSGLPIVVTPATSYTYKAADANGNTDSLSFSIEVYSPVSVEHESVPEAFALHGNFPNPFRHTTQLLMDLPWPARVTVEVMDVIGRRILTTPSTDLTAGWQRSVVLSTDLLPSGLYLYRVHASSPVGRVVHAGRFVHVR
ncbi:MAG: hypothetical protein F4Y90_06795, partial [Rhodothermaceae bacterium]|nr:hypothetical protein [Rhodothermaceae bacterium]